MTASITRGRRHTSDGRLGGSPASAPSTGRRGALLLAVAAALLVALVLALMLVTQVARADCIDGDVAASFAFVMTAYA